MPALTPAAEQVRNGFLAYARARRGAPSSVQPALRTLRVLLAHLGGEAPLLEEDVRLLARQDHYSGTRLLGYLRLIGHLTPDDRGNAHLARARRLADSAPVPFRTPVHRWIDVLTGAAPRRSHPQAPVSVCGYVRRAVPVLKAWRAGGIEDLRAITHDHITRAVAELTGSPAQARAVALRSLFRALKREGLIFRDPARHAIAPSTRTLPSPLHEYQLRGVLRQIPAVRTQLTFVLAAIHALSTHDQRGLLLDDLDRAAGTLLVRRHGGLTHTPTWTTSPADCSPRGWSSGTAAGPPASTPICSSQPKPPSTRPTRGWAPRPLTDPCVGWGTRSAACAGTESWMKPGATAIPCTWCGCSESIPAPPSPTCTPRIRGAFGPT